MSKYFHLSEAASLAVHSLGIVALESGKLHTVRELAGKLNASEAHLAKVMQRLVKTGLVESHRGPSGGFALTKKPEEITLNNIFSAIEGEETTECCPLMKDGCSFNHCIFSGILLRFQNEFKNYIMNHTLNDFIKADMSESGKNPPDSAPE